ncbi:MAG: hypothetical protein VXV96_14445 [Bdellovibrionota bacterium]|jgi:hypothetical protein|nr:hypothetical protein [Bdellovibrionota bacterium]
MLKWFVLLLLFSPGVLAKLKEDTKFVARILGASDSKRTILVNRGKEHGLGVDQHAKISLPTGIIARAVTVKLSPSRSVWSVYRFFDMEKIEPQRVATFKIASPVRLTSDESKALGSLAQKVTKKTEEIPVDPKFEKEQKKTARSILKSQKVTSQFDNIDYTLLEEDDQIITNQKLDPELDWTGLNGKKDRKNFDASLDYSQLK